jgi:hypothetical protein
VIDAAGVGCGHDSSEQAVDGKPEPARVPAQRGQLVLIGVALVAAFACIQVTWFQDLPGSVSPQRRPWAELGHGAYSVWSC